MHARTKIKDLTNRQFDALDVILKTRYEFPESVTRVCVVFELTEMHERHAEMPAEELAQVLRLLELVERGAVAEATLTDAERPDARKIYDREPVAGDPQGDMLAELHADPTWPSRGRITTAEIPTQQVGRVLRPADQRPGQQFIELLDIEPDRPL